MDAKIAVVVGASGGIGRAIAIQFAKRGWAVVLHGNNNLQSLEQTVEAIRNVSQARLCAYSVIADIADSDSSRSMVDAIFSQFPRIDAWVNAAGADVLTGAAKNQTFAEKLTRLWETDVRGTMILSRYVASRMIKFCNPGSIAPSIIHLGWDQSERGMEGDSGQFFAAVKSAVASFSKSLALSVAPHIRVNCVAPGWVRTSWGNQTSDAWSERAVGESMLNRWGTPEDVARAVATLCSEDGAFINGQTIPVNGGWKPMHLSIRSETDWS